jgi:hypothetical protein
MTPRRELFAPRRVPVKPNALRLTGRNPVAAVVAAIYGLFVGTGILTALLVLVSLWGKESLAELLGTIQASSDRGLLLLQRFLFLGYVFASAISAIAFWRRQLWSEQLDFVRLEMRGRIQAGLGAAIGELSRRSDELEPLDPDRLEQAIELSRHAYDTLKGIRGGEVMALNNLVFYLAIQGDPSQKEFVITRARELKIMGKEFNYTPALLTFARAILRYGGSLEDLEEARKIAADLAENLEAGYLKREAELYSRSFRTK